MPESFLDTLARLRQQSEPQPAPAPTQPLPTQYDSVSMPGGRLTDADTYTQGAEKFRVAGVDAPELMDKATHTQLLQPGQEAYANAAALFQNYGSSQRRGVDIHGRTVATPFDTQGRDIAAEEVRQGIAPPVDFNRSGVMPYAKEAAEYFDKTHPPSEAAQAQAEFTGGKLIGKTYVPEPPDPKKRGYLGELGAGLKRGIDQGQAGLYGATSLAGKLLADESRGSDPLTWKSDDPRLTLQDRISNWLQRVGNTGAMRNDEESSRNPAAYSFDDVLKGKGDLLQWMMGAVGEAAPSTGLMLATSLATGGLGAAAESVALRGLAGKALQGTALSAAESAAATALRRKLLASGVLSDVVTPGMLNTVAKEVAANPLKFALRSRAANAGTFLGAWGGSAALEGGHDWTDAQQALGPQADPRYALGAGLAAGLLDTAALHVMMAPVAKMFATPVAEATLATLPGRTVADKMGGLIGAMAKGGLHGILAEAPTEGLQEVISAASVELQKKSDVPLIDRLMQPDYVKRYIEAVASGMAFGGLFSGASHGIGHLAVQSEHSKTEAPASEATPQPSVEAPPLSPEQTAPTSATDVAPLTPPLSPEQNVSTPESAVDIAPSLNESLATPSIVGRDASPAFDKTPSGVRAYSNAELSPTNTDLQGSSSPIAGTPLIDGHPAQASVGPQAVESPTPIGQPVQPLQPSQSSSVTSEAQSISSPESIIPQTPQRQAALTKAERKGYEQAKVGYAKVADSNALAAEAERLGRIVAQPNVTAPLKAAFNGRIRAIEERLTELSQVAEKPIETAQQTEAPIQLQRGQSVVLRPGERIFNDRNAPAPELPQERGPLPEQQASVRRQMELAQQRAAEPAPTAEVTPAPSPSVAPSTTADAGAETIDQRSSAPVLLPASPAPENSPRSSEGTAPAPSPAPVESNQSLESPSPTSALLLQNGKVRLRYEDSTQDKTVSRAEFEKDHAKLFTEALATKAKEQNSKSNVLIADGSALTEGISPEKILATAPNVAAPSVAETKASPVTRTDLTPEALQHPDVRQGVNHAKRLTNAWADLLGAKQSDVPITVEQARALSGIDPKAQFQASVKLARDYAKTFVAEKWNSAGDQVKKKVQEVYKKKASKIDFDSWLAREVGDALLNDDYMRRLYADAHQSLAYRWLREVGAGLAKLAKAVLSQFGLKESSPAIAEFVRSLVDHRRTELAERNGLSIRNSIDMKELTNQLLGGKDTSTQLNLIADRLTEDRAGPLYTRWLSALHIAQRAVEALSTTEPKLREQVQDALRSAVNRADPFWQTPGAMRRRLMRQRASDVIRALPAVEGASPEAMQAIREIANLASKLEDSLAVAQSFAAATDALLPVEQGKAKPRGRALADLMQESEDVRVANRGVTQAFLDALQQEGTQQFEAATQREADPALVERLRAALADREKLATALQMNDVQLAGTGAKALLSAVWKAMGFAAEEVPRIVPTGKVWEHVGVQIDARQDAVAGVIEGASQYAAASRLMERLPAAFRDALARAYQREGEGDPIQWYGQQIALALRSDPALWLTLYQTVPESASDAEAMNRLTTERRTYNHLLRQAVTAEETAVPEVAEALRERLRGRYGREAMDSTERLLGTTGSPLHAWFLLAQGYLPTKDAAPQFTKERSRQVQGVLRDAKMLLDLTPGISEASVAEQAKFLQQNLPALAGFEPDFNHLSPRQNAAEALVEWFNRLNPDQQGEVTPGEAVEDQGDSAAVVGDEEEWIAKALEDGAAMADSDEFYQQKREAEERKTVLENTIALLSDYSPKKGRASAQLIRRFRVLEQGATESALLNSDQATDFAPGIPLNERFEADLGDANFRNLPADLQHVLLQRAQVLSRMGIVPEYRLAQHETTAGRSITYAKESLVLNDQATLQAGTMKNGAVVSQLALDFAKNLFEESRRFVSRWTHAAKFGSPRDARFGAIEFDVRSALDHPLLSRLVEAIDRDSNIGTELRRLAADYAMIPEPGLLDQATKLLPALRQSIELDSGLHEFMSADPARFAQLLVGAMGFDQEVFHNDYGPELNDPNLRPHERATQIRNTVLIDPKYAKELGLKPKQGEKGVYYPLTIKGENSLREVLNAFVRMFVASYDPNTNTLKSGAKATISADALVGVGGKTLTGLEASPNSNFDRIHRLYRGFDLASQLANPWVPVDEFWQNWHGLNDKRLENDPHMNLILFRGQDETMTISDALAARKVADILQGDGVENQNFNEKSLSELDEDIQFWQGRMDELKRQHDLSNGQSLTEQARADDGRTLWTFEDQIPPDTLNRLKHPKQGKGQPWLSRFRWDGQPKEIVVDGVKYAARPFLGVEEVSYAHSRIGGLRARIAELRERLKSEGYINEKRGLGGSQLNYYQNIEEELGRYQAWVDSLGLGNNAARINPEQVLFNPDLNSQEVKWNADLREYQRQGYTDVTLRGEAHNPSANEGASPTEYPRTLSRFVNDTATLLNLDPSQYSLELVDLNRLQALKGSANFAETMRALGYAGVADNAWNHVLEEPVFTVFKDGHARIVALSTFTQGEETFLRNAIAHELGHIYFRTYLEGTIQDTSRRDALRSHLGLEANATDLQIEEAVAEAVRDQVVNSTPAPKSLVGRIFDGIRSALNRLVGKDNVTLESLLEHIVHRTNPSDGTVYFSGRKLLNQSKGLGQGTWDTMKDLYSAVVRTSHSWLRAQRNSEGNGIEAFRLMADILRWTAGKAPQSRALGGQLFDFSSTDGSYRISYEQATQRFFARFGHRVETMLNSWNPAREKASIWNAQQRAEIAETQRQRQVQAVRDYVANVKSKEAEQLRQYFDTMGNYFGEVLKRYDAGKTLPRIFNQEVLRERKADFVTLLEDTGVETEEAEKIYAKLAQIEGSDYRNDPEVFFAPHFQRARMGDALDRLTDAQLLPFLLIDSQPQAALWQYTHQAVKRTEFERRFGGWVYADQPVDFSPNQPIAPKLLSEADAALMQKAQPVAVNPLTGMPRYELPGGRRVLWDQTAKWRLLRANAAEQGATSSQLNYFLKATEAELGRYGANFSPRLRTMQSALVAGMNWAVLPLSLTSQVTDLALPLLRSNGDFKAAWAGMKKTIAELRTKGDLYAAAKANGILSGNLRSYFASSYLDAPFMDTWAMRWNERLFKYNGMEKATEFTRMFAFATGAEWVKSLAAKDTAEANAQLAQLGLDRADVLAWQAQQEKLDTGEGAPDEASERVQQALNTFVEQSMFRPSASQRPVWASHPAAMLVWYLKSYMWAYTDTVLSRTWREFQRLDGAGQKALMLALPALFMMPLAALGLALRNELRDDLDGLVPWRTPKPQKELDATDELMILIGRTGLLGPMQTLLDANRASEYGSPYYLSLIGPFATMSDQIFKEVGTAKEGHRSKATADVLMRLMPVMGSLPQERKAILDAAF